MVNIWKILKRIEKIGLGFLTIYIYIYIWTFSLSKGVFWGYFLTFFICFFGDTSLFNYLLFSFQVKTSRRILGVNWYKRDEALYCWWYGITGGPRKLLGGTLHGECLMNKSSHMMLTFFIIRWWCNLGKREQLWIG